MTINSSTKIEVMLGCANYLIDEVERLRNANEKLNIENRAYDRILKLAEAVAPESGRVGYGEDRLWQAKQEVCEAIKVVEEKINQKSQEYEKGEVNAF